MSERQPSSTVTHESIEASPAVINEDVLIKKSEAVIANVELRPDGTPKRQPGKLLSNDELRAHEQALDLIEYRKSSGSLPDVTTDDADILKTDVEPEPKRDYADSIWEHEEKVEEHRKIQEEKQAAHVDAVELSLKRRIASHDRRVEKLQAKREEASQARWDKRLEHLEQVSRIKHGSLFLEKNSELAEDIRGQIRTQVESELGPRPLTRKQLAEAEKQAAIVKKEESARRLEQHQEREALKAKEAGIAKRHDEITQNNANVKAEREAERQKNSEALKDFYKSFAREDESEVSFESEKSLASIEVGQAELELHGQDAILSDREKLLFGIFDGAGGAGGDPKAAANAAKLGIISAFNQIEDAPKTIEEAQANMKKAFETARKYTDLNGENGITTATVLKLETIDGETYAFLGHAGDSRLYIKEAGGRIYQATQDHGTPLGIYNAFGRDIPGEGDEFGYAKVSPGDRIMICSDGITGDKEEQFLSTEEFEDAFGQETPQASADRFVELSKKRDDKSVLVIDVDEAIDADVLDVLKADRLSESDEDIDNAPSPEADDEHSLIDKLREEINQIEDDEERDAALNRLEKYLDGELGDSEIQTEPLPVQKRSFIRRWRDKFYGVQARLMTSSAHEKLSNRKKTALMGVVGAGVLALVAFKTGIVDIPSGKQPAILDQLHQPKGGGADQLIPNSPKGSGLESLVPQKIDVHRGEGFTQLFDRIATEHGHKLTDAQLYDIYNHMPDLDKLDGVYRMPNGDLGISGQSISISPEQMHRLDELIKEAADK